MTNKIKSIKQNTAILERFKVFETSIDHSIDERVAKKIKNEQIEMKKSEKNKERISKRPSTPNLKLPLFLNLIQRMYEIKKERSM